MVKSWSLRYLLQTFFKWKTKTVLCGNRSYYVESIIPTNLKSFKSNPKITLLVISIKFYQGILKVFTVVINFIASITPSFIPIPESLIPPKGEDSIR